jgi:hypothetical protein
VEKSGAWRKAKLETSWSPRGKEGSSRGAPVLTMIGAMRSSTISPFGDQRHCRVRRESGSLDSLEFGLWCRGPTGTAKFSQIDENLSPSGIATAESICVAQICLKAQMIIATAEVVPWLSDGQFEPSSRESFSRGLSLLFPGGPGVDEI